MTMKFRDLQVGDEVDRKMGHDGPLMRMVVISVSENLIYCNAVRGMPSDLPLDEYWKFDRDTGVEEDEELGWGVRHGKTGTYLVGASGGDRYET